MSVTYKTDYDDLKDLYPELKPLNYDETEDTEILDRFTNSVKTGIWLLPGHTVSFTFSLEGTISSLKGGHASNEMTHQVVFNFSPMIYRPFTINYKY